MTSTPTSTPSNTPSFRPSITITGSAAASLVELLEHCERFLRTAGPVVRTELDTFLTQQPSRPGADWLIDLLGFNALYLQGKLAPAHHATDTTAHHAAHHAADHAADHAAEGDRS